MQLENNMCTLQSVCVFVRVIPISIMRALAPGQKRWSSPCLAVHEKYSFSLAEIDEVLYIFDTIYRGEVLMADW